MKLSNSKEQKLKSSFLSVINRRIKSQTNLMILMSMLIAGSISSASMLSLSQMAYGASVAAPIPSAATAAASAAASAATAAGAKQDAAAAAAGAAASSAASGGSIANIAAAAASAITSHGGNAAAARAAAAAAAAAAAGARQDAAAATGAAAAAGKPSSDISSAAGGGAAGNAAAAAAESVMAAAGKSSTIPTSQNISQQPTTTPLAPQPPVSRQQQTQPLSSTPPLSSPSKEQSSSPIPGLIPSEQIPPTPPSSVSLAQGPVEGLRANGTINSLIYAPTTNWIATGNWSIVVNNGNISSFKTNMTWYNNNGTGTHTHEFINFKSSAGKITIQPGNSIFLKGVMDVGTNHRIVWKNVHSTIDIKGGKTISISLNTKETKNHFAGQTIYGVVTSLTHCSDEPGPNMEVLPPCS